MNLASTAPVRYTTIPLVTERDTGDATISLTELLPAIHALPRADKLRLMQVLVAEIASEEAVALPRPDMAHSIWTPYDVYDAAAVLLHALNED